MKKNKEDRLNEKFDLMYDNYINGNLFDFQISINRLNKRDLVKFILKFLNIINKSSYEKIQYNLFIDCLQRSLNKEYR